MASLKIDNAAKQDEYRCKANHTKRKKTKLARTLRYPNHTPKQEKKKMMSNEYPYVPHVYVKKQTAEY